MAEEKAPSPVARAAHTTDNCSAAQCIIRHDDVRRFWFERFSGFERVPWEKFWCELFSWLPPGSCAAVRSLRNERELREKCQLIMTRAAPSLGMDGVSVIDLNLVFSPPVPLITCLSELVAATRQTTSERTSLAVAPPSDVYQVFKQSNDVYTSQCFRHPRDVHCDLMSSISHHLNRLDTCCKCLAAVSGTVLHSRATYSDIDAADAAGLQHDAGLPSPVSTFNQLRDALLCVRAKLHKVCHPLQTSASPGNDTSWPHVLSLVGPMLSGKSTLSQALADTISKRPTQPLSSGLTAPNGSSEGDPAAAASVLQQPGPTVTVALKKCHSLEECVQVIAATFCARRSSRDICAAFRLILPNSIIVLDDVDMVPCQHIAELVRLLLSHAQVASIVLTSCNRKLKGSNCVTVEETLPWKMV